MHRKSPQHRAKCQPAFFALFTGLGGGRGRFLYAVEHVFIAHRNNGRRKNALIHRPSGLRTGSALKLEHYLRTSFPHRSVEELAAISRCYLGITTLRQVCEEFDIDRRTLPHEI
jgi:hypothetical protein